MVTTFHPLQLAATALTDASRRLSLLTRHAAQPSLYFSCMPSVRLLLLPPCKSRVLMKACSVPSLSLRLGPPASPHSGMHTACASPVSLSHCAMDRTLHSQTSARRGRIGTARRDGPWGRHSQPPGCWAVKSTGRVTTRDRKAVNSAHRPSVPRSLCVSPRGADQEYGPRKATGGSRERRVSKGRTASALSPLF